MTSPMLSMPTSHGFRRLLLVALCLLSLQSCSTTPTVPLPVQKVLPPEACLTLAEPLHPLADPSMESLFRKLLEVAAEYHALAYRHGCLVQFERMR